MTVQRIKSQLCDEKSTHFIGVFVQFGWYFSVAAWIFNPLLYQLSYLGTVATRASLLGAGVIRQGAGAVQRDCAEKIVAL